MNHLPQQLSCSSPQNLLIPRLCHSSPFQSLLSFCGHLLSLLGCHSNSVFLLNHRSNFLLLKMQQSCPCLLDIMAPLVLGFLLSCVPWLPSSPDYSCPCGTNSLSSDSLVPPPTETATSPETASEVCSIPRDFTSRVGCTPSSPASSDSTTQRTSQQPARLSRSFRPSRPRPSRSSRASGSSRPPVCYACKSNFWLPVLQGQPLPMSVWQLSLVGPHQSPDPLSPVCSWPSVFWLAVLLLFQLLLVTNKQTFLGYLSVLSFVF